MTPAKSPTYFSDDRTRAQRQRLKPRDVITRAAVCELLRAQTRAGALEDIEGVIWRTYGGCTATVAYVEQRAAVSPASTAVAGWAQELVQSSIADFLSGPSSASAFAALAEQAMSITLPPGTGVIKVPSRASPQVTVGNWIGEFSGQAGHDRSINHGRSRAI